MSIPQPPDRRERENEREGEAPATPQERAFTPEPKRTERRGDEKPPEEKRIERYRER
jgi:hypothetical protein